MQAELFNATVTQIDEINEYTAVFHITPDAGEVPDFKPGQFTTLGLPERDAEGNIVTRTRPNKPPQAKMIRRAYSIASAPSRRDAMEFFIVRVDEGALTPLFWELGVGGRVWMSEKISGDFTLDNTPPGKHVAFVSTGTGIAPFVSMLRFHAPDRPWRRSVLINGCRLIKDLGYVPELRQLERDDAHFRFIPMVTREPEDIPFDGVRGRCQKALEPDVWQSQVGCELTPDDWHVFLCGNPQMIDQCEEMLHARGFVTNKKNEPGNLHFERYW